MVEPWLAIIVVSGLQRCLVCNGGWSRVRRGTHSSGSFVAMVNARSSNVRNMCAAAASSCRSCAGSRVMPEKPSGYLYGDTFPIIEQLVQTFEKLQLVYF